MNQASKLNSKAMLSPSALGTLQRRGEFGLPRLLLHTGWEKLAIWWGIKPDGAGCWGEALRGTIERWLTLSSSSQLPLLLMGPRYLMLGKGAFLFCSWLDPALCFWPFQVRMLGQLFNACLWPALLCGSPHGFECKNGRPCFTAAHRKSWSWDR